MSCSRLRLSMCVLSPAAAQLPDQTETGVMLAIETSQRVASVALRDRSGVLHEEKLSQRKRHVDDLMPAIDRMFKRANLQPGDLRHGAVAVSIGPGGFTGLRIAIATAKMLAEALDVKLIAVPSALVAVEASALPALNWQQTSLADHVMVALACKADSFWQTRAQRDDAADEWRIVGEPGIIDAARFDVSGTLAVLADEHFPDAAQRRLIDAGIPIIAPTLTAVACLRIALRKLERGEVTDPLQLLPLYPRQPEAVTLWEKRQKS